MMAEVQLSSSDSEDSSSSSSESDDQTSTVKRRTCLSDRMQRYESIFNDIKHSPDSEKLKQIISCLNKDQLRTLLGVAKKVYLGRDGKRELSFRRKHRDYFMNYRQFLDSNFDDLQLHKLRRDDLIEKLDQLSEKHDGRLLKRLISYSTKLNK